MFSRALSRTRSIADPSRPAESVEASNYRNLLKSGAWFGPMEAGVYNFLSVFVARLGATPTQVSWLTAGPALVSIFALIPAGVFAERHTDQVKLLVRAGFVGRLAPLLIALLPFLLPPEQVVPVLIIIWSLVAIANAVHMPAWTLMMQQAVSPALRPRLNGTRWGLMSLMAAISLAVYGALLGRTAFPLGYQIVFVLSVAAGMVNLYYFTRVIIPPFVRDPTASPEGATLVGRVRALFRSYGSSPRFRRFIVASTIYRLALAMPAGLFSIFWVNDLHATDGWIGLRGSAGYIALLVGYVFWGRTANRVGHRRMLLICGAGMACYPALTALAPSVQWLLPVALVWGVTAGGLDLGLFDMLLAACPAGRQPSFAAASSTCASVAVTVGPLMGAALAQTWNTRSALLAIAVLQLIATLAFLLLPGRQAENSE